MSTLAEECCGSSRLVCLSGGGRGAVAGCHTGCTQVGWIGVKVLNHLRWKIVSGFTELCPGDVEISTGVVINAGQLGCSYEIRATVNVGGSFSEGFGCHIK